jgi:hypothetical protein
MTTNMLSLMQMRDNDLHVNAKPKFMVLNATEDHHAIFVPALEDKDELRIPISCRGSQLDRNMTTHKAIW